MLFGQLLTAFHVYTFVYLVVCVCMWRRLREGTGVPPISSVGSSRMGCASSSPVSSLLLCFPKLREYLGLINSQDSFHLGLCWVCKDSVAWEPDLFYKGEGMVASLPNPLSPQLSSPQPSFFPALLLSHPPYLV